MMRGLHQGNILILAFASTLLLCLANGCSSQKTAEPWTPRPCTLPDEKQDYLLNGLVVQVCKFDDDAELTKDAEGEYTVEGMIAGCGSATVLGDDLLMLTDHQVSGDKGYAFVDGQCTEYHVLTHIDGPSDGGGCAIIRLTTPLSGDRSSIDIDFTAQPDVGDTVFVVYCPPPETPKGSDKATITRIMKHPNEPVLVEGRVLPPPPDTLPKESQATLRGFLRLDAECPHGASGSPIIWQREDDTMVVIAILEGELHLTEHHWLTGKPTETMISAGELAFQPREYEPAETPAKNAAAVTPPSPAHATSSTVASPLTSRATPWIFGAGGVLMFTLLVVLLRR